MQKWTHTERDKPSHLRFCAKVHPQRRNIPRKTAKVRDETREEEQHNDKEMASVEFVTSILMYIVTCPEAILTEGTRHSESV